jgi:hypothetical protein
MVHEVFICYASRDKAIADAVCDALESRQIKCWIAPRDVLPGTEWAETIVDALDESRVLVLVLSSSSNTSPQVIREVGRAASKGIPIIPIRIDDVVPSKAMDFFVSSHHWLDAQTGPLKKHLKRLTDTVQQILARKGAPREVIERAEAEEKARREVEEAKKTREAEERAKREAEEARKAQEAAARAKKEEEAAQAKREAGEAKKAEKARERARKEADKTAKEREKREAEEAREQAKREAEEARRAKEAEEKPLVSVERPAKPVKVGVPLLKQRWLWAGAVVVVAVIALIVFLPRGGEEAPPPAGEEPPPGETGKMPPEEEVTPPEYTVYVGGCFALTGAYAEDMAADLAGYEDYIKWMNENKIVAPWYPEKTIPDNVTFEVMWRDDELDVEKVLTIYEELKDVGLLVERVSGSPQAQALMDILNEDRIGATSVAAGPYLLSPPKTIFTHYPIYTDGCAAFADWFLENWTEDRAPRFAFLTADNAMGRSVVTDEMKEYLESIGYEVVGEQYVPLVPTAPPTTQLLWLKDNHVDCCFGFMINPGSQPTVKEMNNLNMGPDKAYKITFGCATPSHLQVFVPAMGEEGNGFVVAGGYASWDDTGEGITFANELIAANRPDDLGSMQIMYAAGIVEAMTQVEAFRLAMLEVPAEELTSADVLEYGFYKIKDLSTGGITGSPLTYGPTDVEGVDEVRIQQVQNGKIVDLGAYPCHHIYKHEY